jgi:hypothetical protein
MPVFDIIEIGVSGCFGYLALLADGLSPFSHQVVVTHAHSRSLLLALFSSIYRQVGAHFFRWLR